MNQQISSIKPHIHLIGGWGSDATVWQAVADLLSKKPVTFSIVDWQSVLRDPLELDRPVVLAGWSLGGILALQTALRCPDQVTGLAMIASTARMCEASDYPGVDSRAIRGMKLKLRTDRESVLRDFTQLCFSDMTTGLTAESQTCEAYRRQSESCDSSTLTDGLNYLLKTDLRDSLGALACRCKILHARGDAVMPYVEAEYLAKRLPNAELVSLNSGMHALPVTEPEQTAEVILSLCQEDLQDDR